MNRSRGRLAAVFAMSGGLVLAACASTAHREPDAWIGQPVSQLESDPVFSGRPFVSVGEPGGIGRRHYVQGRNVDRCAPDASAFADPLDYAAYNAFTRCLMALAVCYDIFYIRDGVITGYYSARPLTGGCVRSTVERGIRATRTMPPRPGYCESDQYDVPPMLIEGKAPRYPVLNLLRYITGTARVYFTVSETGDTAVIRAETDDEEYFMHHAVNAVRMWKFAPAIKDGALVSVECLFVVEYTLS